MSSPTASVPTRLQADRLEPDVVGRGMAAEGGEQLVRLERGSVVELDPDGPVSGDTRGGRAKPHVDTGVPKRCENLLGGERLLALDQPVAAMDERDRRAERRPGLCHLDADDPAAENGEPCGHDFGGRRLDVRPGACRAKAWDVGDERRRPGCHDDCLLRREHLLPHEHAPLAVEPSAAAHERDATLLEPRQVRSVVEMRDHVVATVEHGLHVEGADDEARNTMRLTRRARPGRSSAFDGMQA